jgi:hypothetical protein
MKHPTPSKSMPVGTRALRSLPLSQGVQRQVYQEVTGMDPEAAGVISASGAALAPPLPSCAVTPCCAALSNHVGHVVEVAGPEQVGRVAARRVVAAVAGQKSARDGAIGQNISHPVCQHRNLGFKRKLSVPLNLKGCRPWPARIGACRPIDLLPEALGHRSARPEPVACVDRHPDSVNEFTARTGPTTDRLVSGWTSASAAGVIPGASNAGADPAPTESQCWLPGRAFLPPATPGGKAAHPVELGQPGAAHRPGASLSLAALRAWQYGRGAA